MQNSSSLNSIGGLFSAGFCYQFLVNRWLQCYNTYYYCHGHYVVNFQLSLLVRWIVALSVFSLGISTLSVSSISVPFEWNVAVGETSGHPGQYRKGRKAKHCLEVQVEIEVTNVTNVNFEFDSHNCSRKVNKPNLNNVFQLYVS